VNEILKLKKKYNVMLMVDEAHSLGVLGEKGRGVCEHFGIDPREVDIFTGSLSKAIPASGGFVAGPRELIIYLQHGSAPFIFSAALGPAAAAAALKSLQVIRNESGRIGKLRENTDYFRSGLKKSGYNTGMSATPILPVILGSDEAALSFSRYLFDCGILATPVIFPAVPKQEARLRLCVTAAQNRAFLDEVLAAFEKMRSTV
jgi:7-keto-8-aminopelargonate synthetase-like enzyme